MNQVTAQQLLEIIRYPQASDSLLLARCKKWIPHLMHAMQAYQIDTPQRQAHFLAQIAHESGRFVYTREIWGPTRAQRGYDSRVDLGNTKPEAIAIAAQHGSTPGRWWCGHGPMQVTGYNNHWECGRALGLDLLHAPGLLELPEHGCMAAAWWWYENVMNAVADTGNIDHVSDEINRGRITKPVGDANGYADRKLLTDRALKALGVAA